MDVFQKMTRLMLKVEYIHLTVFTALFFLSFTAPLAAQSPINPLPIPMNGMTFIVPINSPPQSNSDLITINEIGGTCDTSRVDDSHPRCTYRLNVLENDTDSDGDPLTITNVGSITTGSLVIEGNDIVFNPTVAFFSAGAATFTYTLSDSNGGFAVGTVSLVVNRAPIVSYDGFKIPIINTSDNLGYQCNATSVDSSQCEFAVSPLANDPVDSDGDEIVRIITYRSSLLEGYNDIDMPLPANGSDNLSADGKQILYKPSDRCFYGTEETGGCDYGIVGRGDSAYRAIDARGAISKIAFVAYSPNNTPPSAENDGELELDINTSVLVDVLENDSDEDGHTFTLNRITAAPQNGTAAIENNQIRYTPNTGFTGSDILTYEIIDSLGAVGMADVTLRVVLPNTPPEAAPDNINVIANQAAQFSVLTNDSDADGHTFALDGIATPPTNGSAEIVENEIRYTPNVNFVGTDQLIYQITDELGASGLGTVTFTITNNAPIASNDSFNVIQNSSNNALNVLLNDTDPDSHSLALQAITVSPQNGTASVVNNQIQYTPNTDFIGNDSLTYQIADEIGDTATAVLQIEVQIDNSIPVAIADQVEVNVGETVTIAVLQNDTDANNDSLTLNAIVTNPVSGTAQIVDNKIVYTPTITVGGTDSLTYRIADNKGGLATAQVTITIKTLPVVTLVSSTPAFFQAGEELTIEAQASDAEDTIASVRFRVQPNTNWMEYTSAPYIHNLGTLSPGTAVVEIQATDSSGALSAIASQTITIAPAIEIAANWDNSSVSVGAAATLTWTASNATQCSSSENASVTGISGSVSISHYTTGTYSVTITCENSTYGFDKSVTIPLTVEKLSAPQGLRYSNN